MPLSLFTAVKAADLRGIATALQKAKAERFDASIVAEAEALLAQQAPVFKLLQGSLESGKLADIEAAVAAAKRLANFTDPSLDTAKRKLAALCGPPIALNSNSLTLNPGPSAINPQP